MSSGVSALMAFLAGFATALAIVTAAAVYMLSTSTEAAHSSASGDKSTDIGPLHEAPSSEADKRVIKQAIKSLRTCLSSKPHEHGLYSLSSESVAPDQHVAEYPTEERLPAMSCQDMEQSFMQVSSELKDRQRHVEAIVAFLVSFGKLHEEFSRELSRLSHVAESHIVAENKTHLDNWWTSISIAMDHLSQDHRYIEVAASKLALELPKAQQEMVVRKLHAKGLSVVQKLREASSAYDTRRKEFARLKEQAVSKFEGMSVGEHSKLVLRLEQSESLLKQARATLAAVEGSARIELPPIIADYEVIASTSLDAIMSHLVSFAGLLVNSQHKSMHITNRLKLDVASMASRAIDKGSNVHLTVLEILEQMERGDDVKVDMRSEAMSALAASLLSDLPALPPNFSKCITEETCVWMNAFLGRMYRDTARSANFHEWFCAKAAIMLNKGKRPDYIDTYSVSHAVFGSSPPQVRNVVWLPHCPLLAGQKYDPEHNIACSGELSFRSGLSFVVSTKIWINWPRDRYAFIPVSMKIELSEISGKIHFGVQKRASFISFLDEPYTRFSVTSEVGGQYKLKDVPRLSSMVIQKIKKYIRSKAVFPKAYKFRLMWPKKWWPEGEDEYKESTSTSTTSSAEVAATPSKSEAAVPSETENFARGTAAQAHGGPEDSSQAAAPSTPTVQELIRQPQSNVNVPSASPERDVKTSISTTTSRSLGGKAEDSSDEEPAGSASHRKLPPQLALYKHELDKTSSLWNRHYRRTFLGGSHSLSLSGEDFLGVEDRMIQLPALSFLLETCQFRHGIRRRAMSLSSMTLIDEVLPAARIPLRLNSMIRMRSNSTSDFRRMKYRETAYSRLLFDHGNLIRRSGYAAVKESIALSVRRHRSLSWQRQGYTVEHISLSHSPGDVYKSCIPGRMRDISLPSDRETLQDVCDNLGITLVPVKSSKLRGAAKATSSLLSNFRLEDWSISKATVTEALKTSNLSGFLGFFRSAPHYSDEELLDEKEGVDDEDDFVTGGSKGPLDDVAPPSDEISTDVMERPCTTTEVSEPTCSPLVEATPKEAEGGGVAAGEKAEIETRKTPTAARLIKFSDLIQRNAIAMKKLMDPAREARGSGYPVAINPSVPAVIGAPNSSIAPVDSQSDADLALQAREAALNAAFALEMPRLQSFLYVGKHQSSNKKWLVLRDGFIGIFDNPAQNTEFGSPRQVIDLLNAVCRPHSSDSCCFELGLLSSVKPSCAPAPSHNWIAIWAESQVQCRAWIMAIQHSSQRRGLDFVSE